MWFHKLQLLSAAAYSLGHRGNDAQKKMGITAGALFTAGYMSADEITHEHRHRPGHILRGLAHCSYNGFENYQTEASVICAESAGALTLFGTALAGIPVGPRIRLPEQLLEWARSIVCRPCAGESRGASCGPGSLRFLLPQQLPG